MDRVLGAGRRRRTRRGLGRRPERDAPRRMGRRAPASHVERRASHHPERARGGPLLRTLGTPRAPPLGALRGGMGRPPRAPVGRPLVLRVRRQLGGRLRDDPAIARDPRRAAEPRRDRGTLARDRSGRRRVRRLRAGGGLPDGAAGRRGHGRRVPASGRRLRAGGGAAGAVGGRPPPRRGGPVGPPMERRLVRLRGRAVAAETLPRGRRGHGDRHTPAGLLRRPGRGRRAMALGRPAGLVGRRGRLLWHPVRRRAGLQDRHRPGRAALRPVERRADHRPG